MPEDAADSLAFAIAGDGYVVESDDAGLLTELTRWAEPLCAPASPDALRLGMRTRGQGAPCLELGDEPALSHEAAEDLIPALEGFLYERLARPERGLTVLHAAVAARAGRAVLFAGESGAGKSVLSLRLARRGWTYLSDDLAPIDAEGRVLAVPRPVSCDAEEIDDALWREVSRDCVCWEATYRVPRDTPGETLRTALYARPERAARSGEAFEIAAVYQLQARQGHAPLLNRMRGPEARAWIFAQQAMHRAKVAGEADALAHR